MNLFTASVVSMEAFSRSPAIAGALPRHVPWANWLFRLATLSYIKYERRSTFALCSEVASSRSRSIWSSSTSWSFPWSSVART